MVTRERRRRVKNASVVTWHDNPGGVAKSHDWFTPPEIFNALDTEFDLDVASPIEKIPWIPARNWYHKNKSGLENDWFGFVWCNPPYGRNTSDWLKKFLDHRNGIALVFARTDTQWFHNYAINADILCFVRRRIKFYKKDINGNYIQGMESSTGSLLIGCGDKSKEVIKNSNLGWIVEK